MTVLMRGTIPRRRWRRVALDVVLIPVALIVIGLEDVVWRALRRLLRTTARLSAVRRLEAALGRLSPWAALPLFLIPEVLGRVGEFYALALLYAGHWLAAAGVYAIVRVIGTLLAVLIFTSCKPALMTLRWFAVCVRLGARGRDWLLGRLQPLRAALRRLLPHGKGFLGQRLVALRRRLGRRISAKS